MVAYIRKADPILILAVSLSAKNAPEGCHRLSFTGGVVRLWTGSTIAIHFVQQSCARVTVTAMDVASTLGSLRVVRLTPVGLPKDVLGGTARMKKSTSESKPAPSGSDIAKIMEEGFSLDQKRASAQEVCDVSEGGTPPAVVQAGAKLLAAAVASGVAGGAAAASSSCSSSAPPPAPPPPPLPPPLPDPEELTADAPHDANNPEDAASESEKNGELEDAFVKEAAPKLRYEEFPVYSEDRARVVGSLVFQSKSGSLDAHCYRHRAVGCSCNMNRTLRAPPEGKRVSQGRPVGHLVAWLWAADAVGHDRNAHAALRRGGGAAYKHLAHLVSQEVRRRARKFMYENAGFVSWLDRVEAVERPLRPGEPDEPIALP